MGREANAGSDSRLDSARWGHQGHTAGAGERDLSEGAMGVRILGCAYKAEAIPYSRRFRCRCFDDEPSQTIRLCEGRWIHGGVASLFWRRTAVSRSVAGRSQWIARTGIKAQRRNVGTMRKAGNARCRSFIAEVQIRTADNCASQNVAGARNEKRVRPAARQRQLRQDRPPEAE